MPEMDGFEATGAIRDAGSVVLDRQIPIVAMTANAMKGDREKCIEAGMNDYVSKPVRPQELDDAIARNLDAADESKPEPAGGRSPGGRSRAQPGRAVGLARRG